MLTGRGRGFTLVEMIVAIVITASVGIAIYLTLAQGVHLWTRAAKDRGEWKLDLWMEKMTEDLRNVFWDPRCPFKGGRAELTFATLTPALNPTSGEGLPVYFRCAFDPRTGSVVSQKNAFENVLMSRPMPKTAISSLNGVGAFELQYYGYDPKAKRHRWESQWNKDCFPEAVKITIEPEKISQRKWNRMIRLPTENACPA